MELNSRNCIVGDRVRLRDEYISGNSDRYYKARDEDCISGVIFCKGVALVNVTWDNGERVEYYYKELEFYCSAATVLSIECNKLIESLNKLEARILRNATKSLIESKGFHELTEKEKERKFKIAQRKEELWKKSSQKRTLEKD